MLNASPARTIPSRATDSFALVADPRGESQRMAPGGRTTVLLDAIARDPFVSKITEPVMA
jgi:hypothetical protein